MRPAALSNMRTAPDSETSDTTPATSPGIPLKLTVTFSPLVNKPSWFWGTASVAVMTEEFSISNNTAPSEISFPEAAFRDLIVPAIGATTVDMESAFLFSTAAWASW